jgi:uncharacterized coiled-coil protein SlyX
MAKVLGFDKDASKVYELENKITLQQSLIEQLFKLNAGYEEEVKRLVGEYDKLYEKYEQAIKFIQKPKSNE